MRAEGWEQEEKKKKLERIYGFQVFGNEYPS